MTTEPRLRPAVRAVILDRAHRVLLVRFSSLWATPGGGIEPGESHLEALARELAEEVGEVEVSAAVPVWTRTHRFSMDGDWDGQHETFYLVHVDDLELHPALSKEALRGEGVTDLAWWPLDELHVDSTRFAPTRLPALVTELLNAGPPDAPLDVGV